IVCPGSFPFITVVLTRSKYNIMKKMMLLIPGIMLYAMLFAQDMSYSAEGNNYFTETAIPVTVPGEEWKTLQQPVMVSFASSNTRYAEEKVPFTNVQQSWNTTAWKGEKVHTQQ